MVYQTEEIKRDVRVCLDQNGVSTALLESGDVDTLALDDIIGSKILEAVRRVHTAAPYYLLEGGHNFGDAVYWGEGGSGWVLLPTDFMRLVVFKMDDWERAVYTLITTDNPVYAQQRSRFGGIRGNAQRPVCALAVRPEGKVLEFYSCKSEDAQVSRAVYLPFPTTDESDGVDISEWCYEAVVYTAAALTLASCGEAEKATAFNELAKTILQ